jgi:hypothetical protein
MPNLIGLPKRAMTRPQWPYGINRKSWESTGLITWIPLGSTSSIMDVAGGGAGVMRTPAGFISSPIFGPVPLFPNTVTSRATVNNARPVNLGGSFGSITISQWIYLQAIPAAQQIMFTCAGVGNGTTTSLDSSHRWSFTRGYAITAKTVVAVETAAAGQWYHFVATDDESVTATQAHLYVDGVERTYVTQTNGSTVGGATGNFSIGLFSNNTGPLCGGITDVRVYNYQMNLKEVQALRSGVGYWDLYSVPTYRSYVFMGARAGHQQFLPLLGVA